MKTFYQLRTTFKRDFRPVFVCLILLFSGVYSVVAQLAPVAYNFTGGPTCGTGTFTLSNSQLTVSYRLMNGNIPVGAAVNGTGNPLQFTPPLDTSGVGIGYTVVGTNVLNMSTTMNGSDTVYSEPAITIVSPTYYCVGDTINLTAIVRNGVPNYGFRWTGPLSWGVSLNQSSDTNTQQLLNATSSMSGVYTVEIKDGHSCGASANITVTITPQVTASLPGSQGITTVCSSNASYTIPSGGSVSNQSSYAWSSSGTGSFSNTGTLTPTYTFGAGETGDVTLMLTAYPLAPCVAIDTAYVVINIMPQSACTNTWLGITTNWFTATNWSANLVPSTCSDNIIIPGGLTYYPVLTNNASVGSVTIENGANINLEKFNLSVCGNWSGPSGGVATITGNDNTGTNGILILSGTSVQTIAGISNIYELKINNSNGVSFASGAVVSITNVLDLQSGNLDVSNGTLTFASADSSQAAIVDNFSPGYSGTISGNVNAQRYYAMSTYSITKQHMMGSPVNAPLLSQFGAGNTSGEVIPQADCDEDYLSAGSPYGNVFSLIQANGAVCGVASWYVMDGSTAAINGQGYSVLLQSSGTLTLSGALNQNSSYTLTNLANSNWSNTTAQHHTLTSGWQLVSNPYLATLALHTPNPGIDGQVQVWQATGPYSGTYQPGLLGSVDIAPYQAYMVHVTNPGTANYTINGSDRVRTPATFYEQNANELDITAQNLDNNLLDKTVIAFNSNATDSFDAQYDANKIAGSEGRHNIYSLNNGQWMGINTLPGITANSNVPVGFEPGVNGNYALSFGKLNTFDPTTYIYLEDLQQHVMYNARNGNYVFTASTADNRNRFVIHFTPPVVISQTNATCNALGNINITQAGTANWNYTITDSDNTLIATGTLNQNNPVNINAAAGTYTLTLTDNNNYTVTKVIQLMGAQPVSAAFSTSSGNFSSQTPVSFTNASQNANSYTWNFGDGETSALINPVHTYITQGIYTVDLTAFNITGCEASTTQTITITNSTTGITPVTQNGINMWSNRNSIYVDFKDAGNVNAVIKIYNILGQPLSNEEYTLNGLYQKEIDNAETAYVIVAVENNDKTTTKKLFISNTGR